MNDLTVIYRATSPQWARMAAASAFTLFGYGCPASVGIRLYGAQGGRKERYSSGYEALLPIRTHWLLSIDCDSRVCGDVHRLVAGIKYQGVQLGIRHSPLQRDARKRWDEGAYRALFAKVGLPYRRLATTCAFLICQELANAVLSRVEHWRNWIDDQGVKLAKAYHHAQAAFALAVASAGCGDDGTWWWGPEELSFTGEPHGIIHHEGLKKYRMPVKEREA